VWEWRCDFNLGHPVVLWGMLPLSKEKRHVHCTTGGFPTTVIAAQAMRASGTPAATRTGAE
jgi:hypothetical protein